MNGQYSQQLFALNSKFERTFVAVFLYQNFHFRIVNPSDLIIRAGIWDLNQTKIEVYQMQQRAANVITSHPLYLSPDPIDNDIAVVRINRPFKFTEHIKNICLNSGSHEVSTIGCFASGWGADSINAQSELSQFLKKVQMDQVDHEICEKQLRVALKKESFVLSDSFLCAGGNENDLCVGDSGAPLICPIVGESNNFVLTAVSSYGIKCFTETPGVYTNVVKFFDWIRDQTEVATAY
jgi:plasma kallikrein